MRPVLLTGLVLIAACTAPAHGQDSPDTEFDSNPPAVSGWEFGTATCPGLANNRTLGPINLNARTGNTGSVGVAYLNGIYFVSARRITDDPPLLPHQVYRLDSAGNLIGAFDQIAESGSSMWGYRDLATDGTFIYGGWENGVARHNADGTGAVQVAVGPAPGFNGGTWRALAFDPAGDGGRGSFWTADFNSSLREVRATDFTLIREFPNIDGWSLFGLAKDPCGDFLWGYARPNAGQIVQIATSGPAAGRVTAGHFWPGCVPGPTCGSVPECYPPHPGCQIQGGLAGVPGGAGGSGNFWDLASIAQANRDALIGHKVYATPACDFCDMAGCEPCDANCDGIVDAFDIEPFIAILTGGPACSACAADADGNGVVDAFDIEPFITCLTGP